MFCSGTKSDSETFVLLIGRIHEIIYIGEDYRD